MCYLKYLIAILYINIALAQNQATQDVQTNNLGKENTQLSQKFRMASYLLAHSPIKNRILSSNVKEAVDLLQVVETNYDLVRKKINEENWLEANAIIDSVLRDLTKSAQLINKKNISQNQYYENLKRVESFVLPVWSNLSSEDHDLLNKNVEKINYLMARAKKQENNKEYNKATTLLSKAYKLKTQLLKILKHEKTVVYNLMFDSPEEEYNYMLKRSRHFLGLVENVLQENYFDTQALKLINTYVEQGKSGISKARAKKKRQLHGEAIDILNGSIKDLSSALRIMGINI